LTTAHLARLQPISFCDSSRAELCHVFGGLSLFGRKTDRISFNTFNNGFKSPVAKSGISDVVDVIVRQLHSESPLVCKEKLLKCFLVSKYCRLVLLFLGSESPLTIEAKD
jgi:hypothetical protein